MENGYDKTYVREKINKAFFGGRRRDATKV